MCFLVTASVTMTVNACSGDVTAIDRSVMPLAYSADQSVLIARSSYTDHEANVVTELVAVDTRNHSVIGSVGNAILGVSWIAAEFVKDSGMLVVVYSSSAEHPSKEGNTVCPSLSTTCIVTVHGPAN